MIPARVTFVLCLVVFAALAAVTGAVVGQRDFDLTSGPEWAERIAATAPSPPHAPPLRAALDVGSGASPDVASGLILLAGGLIVTVVSFGLHARRRTAALRLHLAILG